MYVCVKYIYNVHACVLVCLHAYIHIFVCMYVRASHELLCAAIIGANKKLSLPYLPVDRQQIVQ